MTDIHKGFFAGEGAQLLAEIKQLHAELTQIGEEWIDKAYRIAIKKQEAWQKWEPYYHRAKGDFEDSLSFMSGIKKRTLQWYDQILDNKETIETARAEGQGITQATVRKLIVKPKKEQMISYISQDDGWQEREAQHFQKAEVTLKPDEGAWGRCV